MAMKQIPSRRMVEPAASAVKVARPNRLTTLEDFCPAVLDIIAASEKPLDEGEILDVLVDYWVIDESLGPTEVEDLIHDAVELLFNQGQIEPNDDRWKTATMLGR